MAIHVHSRPDPSRCSGRRAGPNTPRADRSALTAPLALLVATLLADLLAAPVSAQSATSLSPDVTIPLGAANLVTADHAVAVDNGAGIVALENLGTLPQASDLIGYAEGLGGSKLLSFDTTVSLAGGVVARPGDVVARNGTTYSIAFSAAAAGLPPGVRTDALAVSSAGGLLLSFDTDVSLPGNLHVADEDLVRWNGTTFSLALDGSQAGLSRALDIDAADDLGASTFLVSFDSSGSIGSLSFADEDVLRRANGTWTLERDGSVADVDWIAADLDAMQLVPEPARGAMLAVSGILLAALGRRPRRRLDTSAGQASAIALGAGLIAFLAGVPASASDGVLEIHQTCAVTGGCFPGDTAGFPVTISTSGSYRLSSNLTMPDQFTSGIVVNASDVSIDLNGFAIIGQIVCAGAPLGCTPSTASGTGISNINTFRLVRVRNGTIRGMGDDGVALGQDAEVTGLRVTSNRGSGIEVARGSVVSGNLIYENGASGLFLVQGNASVTKNVIARNGTNGISGGASPSFLIGALASGNSIYQNGLDGVSLLDGGAVVTGNTIYDNGRNGIIATDAANVNGNTIASNSGFGLSNLAGLPVAYTDNLITSNGTNVEADAGIHDRGGNSCGGTAVCP
ncbi:MAG: right-handed parallel beta-helix repeat-containing protein [Deltaproteobacteria bacterium]|nr:right-handed parallel beta-helix repeat-containing protein [Deltaproteobacteria bacterium]